MYKPFETDEMMSNVLTMAFRRSSTGVRVASAWLLFSARLKFLSVTRYHLHDLNVLSIEKRTLEVSAAGYVSLHLSCWQR